MGVWITTVCILFVLFQLFEWLKGFMLPLPIYVLAGAFLAIASNYEKGLGALLKPNGFTAQPLHNNPENSPND